jgi:hypothetical protein
VSGKVAAQRTTHLVSLTNELLGDLDEFTDFVRHGGSGGDVETLDIKCAGASLSNSYSHGVDHVLWPGSAFSSHNQDFAGARPNCPSQSMCSPDLSARVLLTDRRQTITYECRD